MMKKKIKPHHRRQVFAAIRYVRARRRAAEQLGVPVTTFLSSRERARCRKINESFDEVRILCDIGEREIFLGAYQSKRAAEAHLYRFLSDVRTCPNKVILHAKMLAAVGRARRAHRLGGEGSQRIMRQEMESARIYKQARNKRD